MRLDLFAMALAVGLATWAFRYGPTRLNLSNMAPDSLLNRFLNATGPAAIATLFVASVLPYLEQAGGHEIPLALGTLAVLGGFAWRRSVVIATLCGAVVFGLASALV